MDGSKVLPSDKLKAELFYPLRVENQDTSPHVIKMAVELANFLLAELCDPKKATSNYLSSAKSKFRQGQITDKEHEALIDKMATNDTSEIPFLALTRKLEQYGIVIGISAVDIGHASINGDFDQGDHNNPNNEFT